MLFGVLTALLAVGLPVAFAFLAINIVGAWLWLGQDAGLVGFAQRAAREVEALEERAGLAQVLARAQLFRQLE
ncbi:MAG: hypothetical protein AAB328_08005, partial [candidate division NC10 bacterium]